MRIAHNGLSPRRRSTCTFNCFALDPRSGALFRSTPLPVRLPAAREASPPRRTLARPSRLRFPQLTRSLLEPTCRWAGTSLPCAAQGLVDAVSVCLAWHATPLRDASGTAPLCAQHACSSSPLPGASPMAGSCAPGLLLPGPDRSPTRSTAPADDPQPVRTHPAMRKPPAGSHLDTGSIPAPPRRTGDRNDTKPRQVRHRHAQARRLG